MPFSPRVPFDDLPPLPPSADLETRDILKLCIEARAHLAELKQASLHLPNPAVLINSIPMLEAQASSEIENIVTTNDELFRFADADPGGQTAAVREALRYRTALADGFASLAEKPLSTSTAVRICSVIKHAVMDVRRVPGTALANGAGDVIYTPPVGEEVIRTKLSNWERYIHDTSDVDPIVRMAVAHYQFEAIHPFTDGNGRTGRVLNLLMLVNDRLLDLPVLYLSRYILDYKRDYYRLLLDVTTSERWGDWVAYMVRGVAETARWTSRKIDEIRRLHAAATTFIRERSPKIYSRELVDLIFNQPYCRIHNVVGAGIAKRETASAYLRQLADIGVLNEIKAGREKLFLHPAYLAVLSSAPTTDNPYPATR